MRFVNFPLFSCTEDVEIVHLYAEIEVYVVNADTSQLQRLYANSKARLFVAQT
jgi:hypothetical protein